MCAPTKQNAGFWLKSSKSPQVLHILLYGQAQLLFFSHWRGTLFAWRILYACTHGEVICKATSIFRHKYVDGCLKQLFSTHAKNCSSFRRWMLEAILFYTCQNCRSFRRWMLEAILFYTCQNCSSFRRWMLEAILFYTCPKLQLLSSMDA